MTEEVVEINDLDSAIALLRAQIDGAEPGTEEHQRLVESYERLVKLRHSIEKDDSELEIEREKLDNLKIDTKKDRRVKIGLGLIQVALPIGVYSWLCNRGFKFEETGAVTSGFFRTLLGKLNPFR